MDQRLFIINELQRVASEIAPESIRKENFIRLSGIPESQLRKHFRGSGGPWKTALKEAGIESSPHRPPSLSEDELMDAIVELWRRVRRTPTHDDMNHLGSYSVRPYIVRWGTFRNAIQHCIQSRGVPELSDNSSLSEKISTPKTLYECTPPVSSVSNHGSRSLRRHPSRAVLGEVIDFRGLRHAPVNEQGVVYLFGMVSHELGFLIESVRTAYPDCEGKRKLDKAGSRWEHVRIEFEYKSRNFKEHGHDPEGRDLIICWMHDWLDSPIDVLELRSEIQALRK